MEPYGNTIQHKREEDLRFFTYNTNSEKVNERSGPVTEKDPQVRALLKTYDVDIVAEQEANVNYSNLPSNLHPNERCRGWFKHHRIETAHNIHAKDIEGTRLQGGTSIRAINRMIDKIDTFEKDPSGMGRWCSVRIRGRNGMRLTMFSAYRPCTNRRGMKSVYSQQEDVLLENADMMPPQKAFLRDLEIALTIVYDRGDQIVLGADMNLNIKSGQLDHLYRAFNLYETILEMHGREGPRTYIGGSTTLDCIICSRTLQVTGCGYLGPEQCIGDHLVLWADFTLASALGEVSPQVPRAAGRKLQLSDPRVVKKYLENLNQKVKEDNLFQRVDAMFHAAVADPMEVDPERFQGIVEDLCANTVFAEEHCRKIKAGKVEWSDTLRRHQMTIAYWEAVINWKRGLGINRRHLETIQLFRLDDINEPMAQISLARAHRILRLQKRKYRKEAKKQHVPNRITFLEDLCIAQTTDRNKKSADEQKKMLKHETRLKQLLKDEAAKKMHRIIKSTKPSKFGKSVSKLEAPPLDDPDGEWITHTTKSNVEQAALTYLMLLYLLLRCAAKQQRWHCILTPSVMMSTL